MGCWKEETSNRLIVLRPVYSPSPLWTYALCNSEQRFPKDWDVMDSNPKSERLPAQNLCQLESSAQILFRYGININTTRKKWGWGVLPSPLSFQQQFHHPLVFRLRLKNGKALQKISWMLASTRKKRNLSNCPP